MAPSSEFARKHPVHLVHPVQNPESCIPCASVGQDWLAGWFAPEVGMSSVEPDGESTTSENENAREWGYSRAWWTAAKPNPAQRRAAWLQASSALRRRSCITRLGSPTGVLESAFRALLHASIN